MKNYKNNLKSIYPSLQASVVENYQEKASALKDKLAKASALGLPALAALVPMGDLEAAIVANAGFGGTITVGPGAAFVGVDIDNDGNDDFFFEASQSFALDLGIEPAAGNYLTTSAPAVLATGACISSASANPGGFFGGFNMYDGLTIGGNWPNGTSGFIGVRFNSTVAGGDVFGWIAVTAGSGSLQVTGWGYEDTLGTPIGAGDTSTNSCGGALPYAPVPTLSEWGLITLGLFLMSFGTIFVAQRENVFGTTAAGTAQTGGLSWVFRKPPFFAAAFRKSLIATGILAAILGLFSIITTGGITMVDLFGAMIAGPVFAYLMHLMIVFEQESKRMRNRENEE